MTAPFDEVERLREAASKTVNNMRAGWAALQMIREAVETIGPVGANPGPVTAFARHMDAPQAKANVTSNERLLVRETRPSAGRRPSLGVHIPPVILETSP